MDNTILQLHDGSVTTLADLKEAQVDAFEVNDKFIAWEALRLLALTQQGGEP